MANQESLEYIISVVDKASNDIQKIQKEIDGLSAKADKASKSASNSSLSFGKLTAAFATGSIVAQGLNMALQATIGFLGDSVQQAMQYESVMRGLNSTAASFGVSQDEARQAALNLSKDGLVTVSTAAGGLTKLFQAGMGLPEAINLMEAYKDQAAFGKAQTLSMDQAVGNLSESFYTENSMIGNLSGQTENYNLIVQRGAAIMGKSKAELTNSERAQAKYLGTMQLRAVVEGDAARSADTLAGAQAKLQNQMRMLTIHIGQALTPAISIAMSVFGDFAGGLDGAVTPVLNNVAKVLVYITSVFAEMAAIVMRAGQVIIGVVKGIGVAIDGLAHGGVLNLPGAINKMASESKNAFSGLVSDTEKISGKMNSTMAKIDKDGLGSFGNIFKEKAPQIPDAMKKASEKTQDEAKRLVERLKDNDAKMADAARDFAHSIQLKTEDFQRSLTDLVIKHRDAIRQLQSDIASLNGDFKDAETERLSDHDDKKGEIEKKYDEETATLKENLNRRLADNTGSDEQLTAYFQAQIAARQVIRDAEMAKEDERYAKQEEKEKKSYEKRRDEIQAKLNEELEIQKKHQADFDAVKDKAAEDDITRLKSTFSREMDEMKLQHEIRMEELRKELEEILALKAANDAKMAQSVASASKSRTVTTSTGSKSTPFVSSSQIMSKAPIASYVKRHGGGVVPGVGDVPVLAKGGEVVLTPQQVGGLLRILENGNKGSSSEGGITINQQNTIYEKIDMEVAMRELGWRLNLK